MANFKSPVGYRRRRGTSGVAVTNYTLSQRVSDSPRNPWKPPAALSPRLAEQPAPKIPARASILQTGFDSGESRGYRADQQPPNSPGLECGPVRGGRPRTGAKPYFPRIEATASAARKKRGSPEGSSSSTQKPEPPGQSDGSYLISAGERRPRKRPAGHCPRPIGRRTRPSKTSSSKSKNRITSISPPKPFSKPRTPA